MKTYEYIFAAIIMVAILLAAVFLTGISPPLYRSTSEIEQLKMAAQKIMAQIILSPGEPDDWGENIAVRASDLSSLGLAVSTVFTREAFTLDPDKVQRLNRDLGALYLQPETVLRLLSLGADYGIKIEFIPALHISVNSDGSQVSVKVLTEQGMPASYVNVTLGAFSVQEGRIESKVVRLNDTDGDGVCSTRFPFNPEVLIAVANHFGIQMANVSVFSSHRGYLIGSFLLAEESLTLVEDGALQIFAVRSGSLEGSLTLMSVACDLVEWRDINNYKVYNVSYVEPNIVAVVALTSGNSLVVAHKVVPKSYSSIAGEVYPPLSYTLERSVKIGFSTYTLKLTVWRMVW